jgi:hypothetical protein
MNILIVTKNYSGKVISGPVISINNYINDTLKNNNIIIIDHNSSKKKELQKKNLDILSIQNIFILIKNFIKINSIVSKADYVEFHSFFDFFLVLPVIFLSNLKKKNIKIYLRGMVNDNVFVKKKIIKKLYLYFIKFFFLKKAVIVCTSKYELNHSSKFFKKNNFIIENNKVSHKYLNVKFKKLKKKKENLKILFYSNISWKKNFSFVYDILINLDFKVELNIYGKCIINEKIFIQMLKNLETKHSVNFYGYKGNEDKRSIFYSNHLLFLPTLDENFGHAIVENFLHYRPCILSNKTPWADNEHYDAGFSIALNQKIKFQKVLKKFFLMKQGDFNQICKASKRYILSKLKTSNY